MFRSIKKKDEFFSLFLNQYVSVVLAVLVVALTAIMPKKREVELKEINISTFKSLSYSKMFNFNAKKGLSGENKSFLNSIAYILKNHDITAELFFNNQEDFFKGEEIISGFFNDKGVPIEGYHFYLKTGSKKQGNAITVVFVENESVDCHFC